MCLTGEEKPRKTSPRNLVPTGDRTRASCVTGAHATTCPTAVDGLISAVADCIVRSVIKLFTTSGTVCLVPMLSCCTITFDHTCSTINTSPQFSWEVFNHPPYSPDLAPSDFHLFLLLKKILSGRGERFHNHRGGIEWHTVVPIPGVKLLQHMDTKIGPTA